MVGSAKRGAYGPSPDADDPARLRPRPGRSDPGLDRAIQAQIGDKLRAMYGELAEQPVPDRFASLIKQLGQPGGGRDS